MFGPGLFGNTFDFDHDGELDPFERAVDMAMFDEVMREKDADEDDEDFDDWQDD